MIPWKTSPAPHKIYIKCDSFHTITNQRSFLAYFFFWWLAASLPATLIKMRRRRYAIRARITTSCTLLGCASHTCVWRVSLCGCQSLLHTFITSLSTSKTLPLLSFFCCNRCRSQGGVRCLIAASSRHFLHNSNIFIHISLLPSHSP